MTFLRKDYVEAFITAYEGDQRAIVLIEREGVLVRMKPNVNKPAFEQQIENAMFTWEQLDDEAFPPSHVRDVVAGMKRRVS